MFSLKFSTDNVAFEDDRNAEAIRIIWEVANQLEHGYDSSPIRDANGNTVGFWAIDDTV